MNAAKIRQTFLDFFKSKQHEIVASAPMVIKNDPTLLFTNAGMNQFKDLFLGNAPIQFPRIADTQKCLRVSGKHNDLEEVGVDTYHHTMFEMLGNWSFGDYFKEDAINWAWELLVDVYKIPTDRIYVTVFEGSKEDQLSFDQEAYDYWKKHLSEERIINGSKKDNFWEMGDTGPCGPCSEIHVDLRDEEERKKKNGKNLVNTGHPQVIEIWNLVFMEFNRLSNGSLQKLPAQHVDTGMGFERLCMVLQGKKSNYDTDVFQPLIKKIEELSEKKYVADNRSSIQEPINTAIRVIADHIRTISFSIADGQLPSNTGAGYVIRRILRRAIRYGYQVLNLKGPFLFELVSTLCNEMGVAFPELNKQKVLIEKVIQEEEISFFRTLEQGIKRMEILVQKTIAESKNEIDGVSAFELYDTYGFPIDLISLIAKENKLSVDENEFQKELEKQKNRSREATTIDTGDWISVTKKENVVFVGYERVECETDIVKYRKIKIKNKDQYQIVLSTTPFYAESGGQIGDTGTLESINEHINITDTKKENNLIVHFSDNIPANLTQTFIAKVDARKRMLISNNHSATHLMHASLRSILGTHVEQKGSLVNENYLRFDFSHFSKISDDDLKKIERLVNEKIRQNIFSSIKEMPIDEAKKLGAMALFGEKYGDIVRVVTFDENYSVELCGGTHVTTTGQIGLFKIISESAVAAGIRRIEAITSTKADEFIQQQEELLNNIHLLLKKPKDAIKSIQSLLDENNELTKELDVLIKEKAKNIKSNLLTKIHSINNINLIVEKIELDSAEAIKDLAFDIRNQIDNLFMVIGSEIKGKPSLTVIISDNLVKEKNWNASIIVRELAKEINGGGGGQAFYATAGGTNPHGLTNALLKVKTII